MSLPMLTALREEGMPEQDPVRYRYLEVLATRMAGQDAAVCQLLTMAFDKTVAEYRQRAVSCGLARQPVRPRPDSDRTASPLAALNHQILAHEQAAWRAQADGAPDEVVAPSSEHRPPMKSVRRFAQTWSRMATAQRLAHAMTRGPASAGPLNSHSLMLRAMSLMQDLSPSYLHRFMAQTDALLWLDLMHQHNSIKDGKSNVRKARAKKAG